MTELLFYDDLRDGYGSPLWHTSGGDKFANENAILDEQGLHLNVTKVGDVWKGALATIELPLVYGTFKVRMRHRPGAKSRGVVLLWPQKGLPWPPEIDFYEIGGSDSDRTKATQTLHYSTSNQMIHSNYLGDFTKWHTIGVTWSPGLLIYTCDNYMMTSVKSDHVPDTPMTLHIQTTASYYINPNDGWPTEESGIDVRWVKIRSL